MAEFQLEVEYVDPNSIKAYERNAKLHPQYQIEQIKESIRRFGFRDPVALWHNEIVEGHGRQQAAIQMGLTAIPVVRLDDMSDEDRRAYMLVHNQTTMNSGWDEELLDIELGDIDDIDMSVFGFDTDEDDENEIEQEVEVEKKVEGDIKFTEYVDEVSQYVVLKFRTQSDWNFINNVLGLQTVKGFSTRRDGKENGMIAHGIGRVVDGMTAVKKIIANHEDMEIDA